jgi:shikimate kinase
VPAPSDNDQRPLVLIGFMATGKSTVGRLCAQRLRRPFLDLDKVIEETAGMTVAEIFKRQGEPGFRRLESEALSRALATPGAVIATGGGAACREENLTLMLSRGFVVALSAPPGEVLKRVGGRSGRPLLDGADDPLSAAAQLLDQREPFYARAHARVETVGRSAATVADEVLAAWRGHGGA